jgi:hypothetical protein
VLDKGCVVQHVSRDEWAASRPLGEVS